MMQSFHGADERQRMGTNAQNYRKIETFAERRVLLTGPGP